MMLHTQASWASSIMPASAITTYYQFYKTWEVFPDDQWISLLAAFISVLAEFPLSSKMWLNVQAQPNPIHLFAYVMAAE